MRIGMPGKRAVLGINQAIRRAKPRHVGRVRKRPSNPTHGFHHHGTDDDQRCGNLRNGGQRLVFDILEPEFGEPTEVVEWSQQLGEEARYQ